MGFFDTLKRLIIEEERTGSHTTTGSEGEDALLEELEPRHITDEEFHELIQEGVTLVDFWAEWCAPCHVIAPSIEDLAREYGTQTNITKLNVDHYPHIAGELGIMGIPTVIVFKDGQEFKRFVGVQPYERFAQAVEEALQEGT
ncbi:MAG: thioredoxin [Chloroflexi bacterium]|nr:thioredoxin [Chloroflexota bacterium]